MQLNYRAIRTSLSLTYKQINNLILRFAELGVITYKVEDGYFVSIEILDINILTNLLTKTGKSLNFDDIKELIPVELSKPIVTDELSALKKEIAELKAKYPSHIENQFFKHFQKGHKQQFFSTFAARVDKGKFTLQDLEKVFELSHTNKNAGLFDMLAELNYPLHDKVMDFLWIQTEGKVANVAMEAKAAKTLVKWIESGIATLQELEDCWLSMIIPLKYNPSLVSLTKAMQVFSKIKIEGADGRFTVAQSENSLYNSLKLSIDNVKL